MNVYDFDDTIYSGDSTRDFYGFCIRKKPIAVFKFPLMTAILYIMGRKQKQEFKSKFYSFLTFFDNVDEVVSEFWEQQDKNIKKWYREKHKEDDVIISASPDFLLRPECEKLGIKNLIASEVDKKRGICTGINCWGEEKVSRFEEMFKAEDIDEFYSDSLSDAPMAGLAKQAYIVRGESLILWEEYKPSKTTALKRKIIK